MSDPALFALLVIAIAFVVFLGIQRRFAWVRCALCAAVSVTWIALLVAYWLGVFPFPSIVAVLMGESIVGAYFAIERRLDVRWHVFRLPLLLSATAFVFALLGVVRSLFALAAALVALWVLFGFVFAYRSHPRMRAVAQRFIACCKNW